MDLSKRQVGGILVIIGGSSAFYTGITTLIFNIFHSWGGSFSSFVLFFTSYINPFLYLILGVLIIIAGIRISFTDSSGVSLALVSGVSLLVLGLIWEVYYIIQMLSWPDEVIYSITGYIIKYIILRDCLIVGGAVLSHRN